MANAADFISGVLTTPKGAEFEPQRSNNALLYLETGSLFGGGGIPDWEQLKLSLSSFPLPKNETGVSTVPFLNKQRKFAGATVYNDMAVSFHDYVARDIAALLWSWRYKVYDPRTGIKGLKSGYVVPGRIETFAPDGSNTITYILKNVWPHSLDMGEIQMGADEPILVNVQFAVDEAYLDSEFNDLIGEKLITAQTFAGP